jgi:NAD(P)-dependent dehydrogenase (short-subunit alcohol dehydrogenase family)
MTNSQLTEPTVKQLFDLTGKVALVTGGTGFLGGAMVRALSEAGATVVVTSRELARAEAVASSLSGDKERSHYGVQLDHLREDSIETGFDKAVKLGGKVDILINNGQHTIAKDWSEVTAEEFTEQMGNATGYFVLARRMRDHVVSRGTTGSIVLLGSMYGLVGSYPDTYSGICAASPVAYHALKGGIVQMTRHLAVYWAADGVRVNCLSPGPFPPPRIPGELTRRLCEKSPLKRMGQAHELKGAVVFLASSASSYMTGQNLVIDGGWTAW